MFKLINFLKIPSLLIGLLFLPSIAIAKATGLGEIAEDLMEPIAILSDFIGTGALIIGVCCLFGAFLRYMQYRTNPMIAPISTVIVLVVLGLALLGVPFIYKLTGQGVPYHLF